MTKQRLSPGPAKRDTPPDVQPGSDADIDRGEGDANVDNAEPDDVEPIPDNGKDGEQMDDNIDDLGRRRPS